MRKGNLLIIDDESDVREIISDILSKLAVNVYTANDGMAALDILKIQNVHLIICDINMPTMNGVEFIKAVREQNIKIPIIFYTGYGSKDLMLEAARYGAFDFIEKPMFYQLEEIALRGMQHGLKLDDPAMPMVKLPHNEITKYQILLRQLAESKTK